LSALVPLLAELDRWQAAGRTATLWLRDDDAAEPCPELEQLLRIVAAAGVPAVLAVIPMTASPALAARLADAPGVAVWQHGICHANRAPAGAKAQELTMANAATCAALTEGLRRLGALFGSGALPVLVPPWNRIADDLALHLPTLGFAGLSTFRPRAGRFAAPGLWQVNAHVDPVDWRGGRRFVGAAVASAGLAAHLAARRTGAVDPDEPTGLLTHHRVSGEAVWHFLCELFSATNAHPAVRWCVPMAAVGSR
jgi:hypothetical protein